jgi:hypothetical protein
LLVVVNPAAGGHLPGHRQESDRPPGTLGGRGRRGPPLGPETNGGLQESGPQRGVLREGSRRQAGPGTARSIPPPPYEQRGAGPAAEHGAPSPGSRPRAPPVRTAWERPPRGREADPDPLADGLAEVAPHLLGGPHVRRQGGEATRRVTAGPGGRLVLAWSHAGVNVRKQGLAPGYSPG